MTQEKELSCKKIGLLAHGPASEFGPSHLAKENKLCGNTKTIGHC
jgi:hypothetical protein